MNAWVSSLQKAKKTCLLHGNLKKVHYALSDGSEMVEEYDTNTYVLTRRAWKIKNELHSEDDWKIEVGDPEPTVLKDDGLVIKENSSQVRSLKIKQYFAFLLCSRSLSNALPKGILSGVFAICHIH